MAFLLLRIRDGDRNTILVFKVSDKTYSEIIIIVLNYSQCINIFVWEGVASNESIYSLFRSCSKLYDIPEQQKPH